MYKRYFICYRIESESRFWGSNSDVVKFEAIDVMFLELNEENSKEPRKMLFPHLRYEKEHYPLIEVSKEEFERRISNSVGAAIYRDKE